MDDYNGKRTKNQREKERNVPLGEFEFDLEHLVERGGVDGHRLFQIFLPKVMKATVWKRQLQQGPGLKTYREIVDPLDEAFLLLVLINNKDNWLWKWNRDDHRLPIGSNGHPVTDPPGCLYTTATTKRKQSPGTTKETGDSGDDEGSEDAGGGGGKGAKNTGWSMEGKKMLGDLVEKFEAIRAKVPEMRDPFAVKMNEYITRCREDGPQSLASVGGEEVGEEGTTPPTPKPGFSRFELWRARRGVHYDGGAVGMEQSNTCGNGDLRNSVPTHVNGEEVTTQEPV